jgi:hypothetical protein
MNSIIPPAADNPGAAGASDRPHGSEPMRLHEEFGLSVTIYRALKTWASRM